MLKPKFNPPAAKWPIMQAARKPTESFERYRERRAIMNRMVKRINADAPGRAFRFRGAGLTKPDPARPPHGGYGRNLMRHYDEQRFPLWKAKQELKGHLRALRGIWRGSLA